MNIFMLILINLFLYKKTNYIMTSEYFFINYDILSIIHN